MDCRGALIALKTVFTQLKQAYIYYNTTSIGICQAIFEAFLSKF
jgi:hypothetical protein